MKIWRCDSCFSVEPAGDRVLVDRTICRHQSGHLMNWSKFPSRNKTDGKLDVYVKFFGRFFFNKQGGTKMYIIMLFIPDNHDKMIYKISVINITTNVEVNMKRGFVCIHN